MPRKPALLPEWKKLLLHAWSMRLWAMALVLEGASYVVPLWQDVLPEQSFRNLSTLAALAGIVARLIPQPKTLRGDQ